MPPGLTLLKDRSACSNTSNCALVRLRSVSRLDRLSRKVLRWLSSSSKRRRKAAALGFELACTGQGMLTLLADVLELTLILLCAIWSASIACTADFWLLRKASMR